jgi:hypothetical protein
LDAYAEQHGYGVVTKGRKRTKRVTRQEADEMNGEGLFKALHKAGAHKYGINKKSVTKAAKSVAKQSVRIAADVAGEAISQYTGNPALGDAFQEVATKGALKAIDTGNAKEGLKASRKAAKRIAVEAVDDFVDRKFSGAEKQVVQKALAGKYPSAKDLIYDYGNSKIEEMVQPVDFSGYGLMVRTSRTTSGRKISRVKKVVGGAIYERPVSHGMATYHHGATYVPQMESDIIQLGSPYQPMNSTSFSPFIAASPQLAAPIKKVGGSIYPSGRYGGSFVPSG